jgi:CheY-like chemotaxis protein
MEQKIGNLIAEPSISTTTLCSSSTSSSISISSIKEQQQQQTHIHQQHQMKLNNHILIVEDNVVNTLMFLLLMSFLFCFVFLSSFVLFVVSCFVCKANQKLLTMLLKRLNMEVSVVANGLEAIRKFQSFQDNINSAPYQLIFMVKQQKQ